MIVLPVSIPYQTKIILDDIMKGLLCKAIAGFYYVHVGDEIFECKARGSFRKEGISPIVGDFVEISVDLDKKGVIESIYERKNALIRPSVANIDKLFIVSSFSTPSPNLLIIDRIIALSVFYNIVPVVVFNKCDLGDFSKYKRIYEKSGFKTLVVSAQTGEGIESLRKELKDCTSAFTGNSGVGKSSLINLLFPNLSLLTGEVSTKLGRGRHTTRHTELFKHSYGGYVADTPGFSSLDNQIGSIEFRDSLAECFPDFKGFINNCKFNDCLHIGEKGCGIGEAVLNGNIEKSRHDNYKTIYNELKSLKNWDINKKR